MAETSAQPSLASAPPEWKYDVFVSFRGDDVRKGFISHLFHALELAEISCYRDVDWDQRGLVVQPMLLDAIRGSRIALVLFSTNYADSRWCLDELVEIMKCGESSAYRDHGHIVVPIFFHVEPSDVRRQQGEFGRGFEHRVAEQGEANLADWRAALEQAGNRSGWHLMNDANGDESLLIENIVGQIFSQTSYVSSPYFIKDAVGIDNNASAVISLLDIGSHDNVRAIGLYGLKGIGKTTLAKLVASRVYSKFEGVSFLENIGDAKREGIINFQKTLLNDVLKVKRPMLDEHDYRLNLDVIKDKLCNKRILLILDNVKEKMQVTLLGGRRGSLGQGSRILITMENEVLLDRVDCKFMVPGLAPKESFQIFSRYAFDEDDYEEELSRNLVHYVGGVPSAIKTLATYLSERTKDQWVKLLEQLARNPDVGWNRAYSKNWDSFLHPLESKVEPYGGLGGYSYDDKGYRGVRQMKITVVNGMLRAMCIDYDQNGSLVRSSWHGGINHGGLLHMVALDYPDEFLTSISGCINTDLDVVQSITIHSNRAKYGPYGDEIGNAFSFKEKHIEGRMIIGFFGKCDSYVNSIGAYFGVIPPPYPHKTIGPFGQQAGNSWDDGKHMDVRQIDVAYSSKLKSISIIYDNYGNQTIPFTHGERGGGEIQSVILAYPYEYLTWISGYLKQHLGRHILQSISFQSNIRKYGPFGEEIGLPFSGPSTGGKIIGFYGSNNSHIESIGAYLEPVSHIYPIRKVGPFGEDGGSPWDDGQHGSLRKLVIRCGSVIHSLSYIYDDDGTSTMLRRGGDTGPHMHTVELDYPNEYLISISGYVDHYIRSLTFKSNRSVYGPYGPEQGKYFSSSPNIGKIVGFYGRCGIYLDSIGAYFAPAFHMDPARTIGPYGGEGGSPWDDGKHTDVRQILISSGLFIDSIGFVYDESGKSTNHGGDGGSAHTIELEYPDEYLTSISGYIGTYAGMKLVMSLTFQSNRRTFGPFGTNEGRAFTFSLATGKIVGFYGRSGLYLDSIGAYLDVFPGN